MGRYPARRLNVIAGGLTVDGVEVEGGAALENVVASSDELNIMDGVTATAAEINKVAGVTGGTVTASKALVVDANKDLASLRNVTLTGNLVGAKRVVEAHTAGDTLAATESGSIHTNEGASGAVALVLPAAVVGLSFLFYVMAAQALRIDPNGTETISDTDGAQGAAGKYIGADAAGEFIQVECVKAGQWEVTANRGTWTHEA